MDGSTFWTLPRYTLPIRGILLGLGDKVLGQDAVFQDGDLDSVVALAHDHLPVHGLPAGKELGFGDDGAAAAGVA